MLTFTFYAFNTIISKQLLITLGTKKRKNFITKQVTQKLLIKDLCPMNGNSLSAVDDFYLFYYYLCSEELSDR